MTAIFLDTELKAKAPDYYLYMQIRISLSGSSLFTRSELLNKYN
jgi:hypothetical protein